MNNPYYDLIKQDCEGYNEDDKIEWIKSDAIYPDWDEPYGVIRKYLGMTEEEFEDYRESEYDDWDDEWNLFCESEQMLLKEYASVLIR